MGIMDLFKKKKKDVESKNQELQPPVVVTQQPSNVPVLENPSVLGEPKFVPAGFVEKTQEDGKKVKVYEPAHYEFSTPIHNRDRKDLEDKAEYIESESLVLRKLREDAVAKAEEKGTPLSADYVMLYRNLEEKKRLKANKEYGILKRRSASKSGR